MSREWSRERRLLRGTAVTDLPNDNKLFVSLGKVGERRAHKTNADISSLSEVVLGKMGVLQFAAPAQRHQRAVALWLW